uniref:Serine/threonine protein kinase n=1 Tax=Stigmatella aurantiaca TaxID=41 RepID=A0A7U3MW92_STIAU|nr:hypothetical protein [Stigmatella aurantiaca]
MELDQMKLAWQSLEQRLERQTTLSHHLFTEDRARRARSTLHPLLWGQTVQLAVGVGLAMFFARFWIGHAGQPLPMVSGLLLHLWSVALVVSAGVQLVLLARANYAQPLLVLQKTLALLRRWRTRWTPWLGVAFWVLWAAVAEVLFRSASGHDLPTDWLLANLLVGGIGIVATVGLFRWLHSPARAHWGEWIDRENAGRSINRAQALLDEIERFERE